MPGQARSQTNSPTPAEELQSRIRSLQFDIDNLHSKVALAVVQDRLEDISQKATALPVRVEALRQRGYPFETDLEMRAADIPERWRKVKTNAQMQARVQSTQLQAAIRPIDEQLNRLIATSRNVTTATALANALESSVNNLETRVLAAERAVDGLFDSFQTEINVLDKRMKDAELAMEKMEQACFTLLPGEAVVRAVKAVWLQDGREDKADPDGYLFLTDQRLIFEQNEEVATKKVLFVTTERKKVQEKLYEVAVSLVDEVKASKQGIFKNEDRLDITFKHGAPSASAQFHIFDQDCAEWQGWIQKVRSGECDRDRVVAVDEEAVEKVRSAPSICPACGGNITQPVLRGMTTLVCEYCGYNIRI